MPGPSLWNRIFGRKREDEPETLWLDDYVAIPPRLTEMVQTEADIIPWPLADNQRPRGVTGAGVIDRDLVGFPTSHHRSLGL